MPSATVEATGRAAAEDAPQPALEWRVRLADGQPRRVPGVIAAIALAAGLAYAVFGHLLPALITGAALLSAVSEFLLPITYRLTAEGVSRRNGLGYSFLAWKDVRRCLASPDGVQLSPLAGPSRLDAFRGITLRLPPDVATRERLAEMLRVYYPQAMESPEGSGPSW